MATNLASFPTNRADAWESNFADLQRRLFNDGVFSGIGNNMIVSATGQNGMTTYVASGAVLAGGVQGVSNSVVALSHSAANPTQSRIDTVIATLDKASPYTVKIDLLTGSAGVNPVAPSLRDNASFVDVPLANVAIGNGISTILAANVTNRQPWCMPRTTDFVGVTKLFVGAIAPSGYVFLEGQTLNTTNYPAVAALFGVAIGTTVTLPNTINSFPMGATSGILGTGGSNTITLSEANLPPHVHNNSHAQTASMANPAINISDPAHAHLDPDGNVWLKTSTDSTIRFQDVGGTGVGQQITYSRLSTASATGITASIANPTISVSTHSGNTGSTGSAAVITSTPAYVKFGYIMKVH